ncbi:MAG: hypothetical protein ACLRMZ_24225 [Blautia marasmi]
MGLNESTIYQRISRGRKSSENIKRSGGRTMNI